MLTMLPNKSPEPTPVSTFSLPGRFSSFHVTDPAWLSCYE
jgi:hypothetical protein